MEQTDSGASVRISVYEDTMSLDASEMCGVRFVPVPSAPLPDHVRVLRVGHPSGEQVTCTEAQADRWQHATRRYLDAVFQALNELHRAHGGRRFSVSEHGVLSWSAPPALPPWPGRRRRTAARSAAAQRVFLADLDRAAEAYRPAREEIAPLVAARRAEREAAQKAEWRRRERLREVARQVAGRRVWFYVQSEDGSTFTVRRLHEPPREHAADAAGSMPLTAYGLEGALLELYRSGNVRPRFVWDPDALAEVERECGDLGVPLTFTRWWAAVARTGWESTPSGPAPAAPRPAPYAGGTGTSGSGGYTGGFGGFGSH